MKMPTAENALHSVAVDSAKVAMESVYRKLSVSRLWTQLRELPPVQRALLIAAILAASAIVKENLPRSSGFWRVLSEVIEDIPSELIDQLRNNEQQT